MQDMLVSIITVCLNAEETIETTIRSVIEQTYKNIEYIIIDGGSTDGTQQILERYREYISVWLSEKDGGIYDAMNKGIKLAHGDYIGIINADDWYEKNAVEYVVQIGKKISRDIGVISGRCRFIEGTDAFLPGKKSMDLIWTEMPIAHPATFVKKSVYGNFGAFDTDYKIAADYELVFRLFVNHIGFYLCEKVLANYRIGGISGRRKDELLKEDVEILKKYQKYCDDPSKVKESIKRKESIRLVYHADRDFFCRILDIEPEVGNTIYIFGCGYWGRELCGLLENQGITVTGFIDNNKTLWGTKAGKHMIEAPETLPNQSIKVIIAVQENTAKIETQVRTLNTDAAIVTLEEILKKVREMDKGLIK